MRELRLLQNLEIYSRCKTEIAICLCRKNSQEFAYLRNDSTANPLDENEKRIRELEQENEKIRQDNRALLDALALATDKQHSSDEPLTA